MKAVAIILMVLVASDAAFAKAENVPLPRPKPGTLNAQPAQPIVIIQKGEPTSANSPCSKILREIATFKPLPDIAGPGECGATDRVELEAIKMPDGSRVKVAPAATLRCPMAEAIAEWVRNDLGQAALDHGSPLRTLMVGTSYQCRPRNGVKGAKISEHGRGNAVDLAGLKLANGTTIDLTRPEISKAFREKARVGACGRFTTVLGPGADAQHEDHIHVDLVARSRGYRMCQWDVREPVVATTQPAVPASAPPPSAPVAKSENEPPIAARPQSPPTKLDDEPPAVRRAQPRVAARTDARPVETVPLPLRRPFETMFAMRESSQPPKTKRSAPKHAPIFSLFRSLFQ
jgi:hypothetical protein